VVWKEVEKGFGAVSTRARVRMPVWMASQMVVVVDEDGGDKGKK